MATAKRRKRNPNSNAALVPYQWKPGQSGNPRGRTTAGAAVGDWLNILCDVHDDGRPKYIRADIEAIVDDPNEAPAKVIAARQILHAMDSGEKFVRDRSGKLYPAGIDVNVGNAFDRVCDRTEGKPVARIHVQHHKAPDPAAMIAELRAALADLPPELRATVDVGRLLPETG